MNIDAYIFYIDLFKFIKIVCETFILDEESKPQPSWTARG
jgi:hypothetical protein